MKIKRLVLIVIFLLLGVGSFFRYQAVNRHYQPQTVKEVMVHQGERVKDEVVHFQILSAKTQLTKDESLASVKLKIKQVGPANYGFKQNYPNFDENMWFNIPYGYYSVAKGAEKVNGKLLTMGEMAKSGDKVIVMNFRTPIDNYRSRNATPRFSFLVPHENHQFTKYSYLLNFKS